MATVTRRVPAASNQAKDGPRLEVSLEWVDLPTALSWLDVNESNRTIRPKKIVEMRRDMLAANWRDVGDSIRFDVNGKMVDGQHRMLALTQAAETKADIRLQFLVVRGIAAKDRVVIDTGSKRTAGDQLKMAGYSNYVLLASAARLSSLWERRMLSGSVTHAEIIDYIEANPGLTGIVKTVAGRMRPHIDMPGGVVAAGYFLCQQVDEGDAFEFFERLTDGANIGEGDPMLALRRRLRDLDRNRVRLPAEIWLSLVLRTWNARREGRSMRLLPLDRGEGQFIPCPMELS